ALTGILVIGPEDQPLAVRRPGMATDRAGIADHQGPDVTLASGVALEEVQPEATRVATVGNKRNAVGMGPPPGAHVHRALEGQPAPGAIIRLHPQVQIP